MTTETMTIHEALTELKTLDKRVDKAIYVPFMGGMKKSQGTIGGKTEKEFSDEVFAAYDKATDLIKRRNAIKRAVVISNANTKVAVNGAEYTVAEAIDMKNNGLTFTVTLRDVLLASLNQSRATAEKNNAELQAKGEAFVAAMMGGKEIKTNAADFDAAVKLYIESNTVVVVDPLNAAKKVEELTTEIDAFMTKIDSALSVSNALTTIEVTY